MSKLDPDDQRDIDNADKLTDQAQKRNNQRRADAIAKCTKLGHVMNDFVHGSSVCAVCGMVLRESLANSWAVFDGHALNMNCLPEDKAILSLCADIKRATERKNTSELHRRAKALERIAFRWYMKTDKGEE